METIDHKWSAFTTCDCIICLAAFEGTVWDTDSHGVSNVVGTIYMVKVISDLYFTEE